MGHPHRDIPSSAFALAAALAALPAAGCRDGGGGGPTSPCRIDYERIDGEPSARFDQVFVADDGLTVTRTVHEYGGAPTRAIYYYFDGDGRLVVEAMDVDLDGELDARLDVGDELGGLVTPYTVDARIEDGNLDGVQLRVPLPSSLIGPWNPASVYFQVSCDQGNFVPERINDEQLNIGLDNDDDGNVDGSMAVQFGADGLLQTWTIDLDGDGNTDHIASVDYDEAGRVTEVFWNEPGELLGDVYILARYEYDAYGKLYAYELDADADGTFDHRITYSAGCFDYGDQR